MVTISGDAEMIGQQNSTRKKTRNPNELITLPSPQPPPDLKTGIYLSKCNNFCASRIPQSGAEITRRTRLPAEKLICSGCQEAVGNYM